MLIRSFAAATVAAFCISGVAQAHPHGWDTWEQYKAGNLPASFKHSAEPESLALAVADRKHDRAVARLRTEWEQFDAAYWASLEPAEVEVAHVEHSEPTQIGGSVNWSAIAQCESGGDWSINTGNGYWGGLQFSPSTWFGYGGGPFSGSGPFPFSVGEQIAVAERVLAGQGIGAWPTCGALG